MRLAKISAAAAAVCAIALAGAPAAGAAGDPLRPQQWNLDMVESDAAHSITTGQGAVVAVIDTGVQSSHPDLQGRLTQGRDLVGGDDDPQDGEGHGTNVTGIIAANEGNGVGVSSVAPGAKVMPIKVLDDSGSGDEATVSAGIDLAVARGADVINLSLSPQAPLVGSSPEFEAAMRNAVDHGVVVVAAAGNDSLPVCENPTVEGRVLCVGAVDRRGSRSFYSSFGYGLGLVAPGGSVLPFPGEGVLSTYKDSSYDELAGTSQATPHVSAVAALLVSRGIRGQAAVNRILATATDAGPPGPDSEYGAGIVNARAAVEGTPAGGPSSQASSVRVKILKRRIGAVLKRGLKVRCRSAGTGRCVVEVTVKGRVIALGSARVRPGRTVIVKARLNSRGRRLLRKATKQKVTIRVTLPGADPKIFKLTLRR
jgi:subtilisin family serine protease